MRTIWNSVSVHAFPSRHNIKKHMRKRVFHSQRNAFPLQWWHLKSGTPPQTDFSFAILTILCYMLAFLLFLSRVVHVLFSLCPSILALNLILHIWAINFHRSHNIAWTMSVSNRNSGRDDTKETQIPIFFSILFNLKCRQRRRQQHRQKEGRKKTLPV